MSNIPTFPTWLIFVAFLLFLTFPKFFFLLLFVYVAFIIVNSHLKKNTNINLSEILNNEFSHLFSGTKKQKPITVTEKIKKPNLSFSSHMPNFSPGKIFGGFFLLLVLFLLLVDGFVSVPAGHVAVIYDRGKGVLEREMEPGLHFKIPFWQTATLMDTRLQVYTMSVSTDEGQQKGDDSIEALTKDGQKVNVDITVQYLIDAQKANLLYNEVGNMYEIQKKVIRPPVRNIVREVVTGFESKQLFNNESRQKASQEIEEKLRKKYAARNIILESSLLRNVRFSNVYLNAIEEKQVAEQRIQKAEFEKQEAEIRKETTIIQATAEAESIKLKGASLRESPEVIQLQFVEKMAPQISWGILPDGALPLIDIKDMQQ